MLVTPVKDRGEPVSAATRVTRVSLIDLQNGSGASLREQQDLLNLLRSASAVAARVAQVLPDGAQVVDFDGADATLRLTLRLPTLHQTGDLLIVTLCETHDEALLSHEVKLSGSAKLIQNLIKSFNNQEVAEISSTKPLVQTPKSAEALARALQHTVSTSGLFYESHLRGWLEGRIKLETLRAEPQALMRPIAMDNRSEPSAIVHSQLAPLVQQQLDTHAQQMLSWRGYVWPDQSAEVMINGESPENEAGLRSWNVRLDLVLPTLGEVQTRIGLTGQAIDVQLSARAATATELHQARAHLTRALSAHGLKVNPIIVAGHG